MAAGADYHREYQKARREQHRKEGLCILCKNPAAPGFSRCEKHKRKEKEDTEKVRRRTRKSIYKLTEAQLVALESITACEICGGPAKCIDHDHNTGKVRGVLCGSCNSMLGFARDDEAILAKAIAYLAERR